MRPVASVALVVLLALATGCSESRSVDTAAPASAAGSPSAPSGTATSRAVTSRPAARAVLAPWRLPAPLSRGVVLDLGDQVLLAGGLSSGDHSSGQVLSVDVQRGTVRPVGTLAQPVHDSAGAVLGGTPYLFGGGGSTESSTVQRGGSPRWRVVADLPGGTRSDLSAVSLGDSALLVGGYDGSTTPTGILRTSDGTHFTVLGHLPAGVRYAGVARVGGVVWVIGGEVDHRELDEVYRLDTTTGRVRDVGRLPSPLGHEAVIPVGHRLLVLGGRTAVDRTTAAMWWFDTTTHRWSRAGRLPSRVADAPWVVRGTRAWLLGGETPDFTDRVVEVSWS